MVNRFAAVLLVALCSFIAIYVVVDLIDHLDDFMNREAAPLTIARYYLHYVPYIVVLTLPVGMLLATLFVIGEMGSAYELVAIKAAGISIYRVAVPLLRLGLLISLVALLLAELVVPRSNEVRAQILSVSPTGRSGGSMRHICRQDRAGYILYAAIYDQRQQRAMNVVILQVHRDMPERRIDADEMAWDKEGWLLLNATDRTFTPGGASLIAHPMMRLTALTLRPEDLARVEKLPEQMSFLELRDYIERARLVGGDASRWLVDLHLKVAFPLANVMMVWLGFPLAARSWRGGKAFYIGLTLLIGFLFFVCIRAGQALGRAGDVNPVVGAWGGDALFFVVGLLLFRWTRK